MKKNEKKVLLAEIHEGVRRIESLRAQIAKKQKELSELQREIKPKKEKLKAIVINDIKKLKKQNITGKFKS